MQNFQGQLNSWQVIFGCMIQTPRPRGSGQYPKNGFYAKLLAQAAKFLGQIKKETNKPLKILVNVALKNHQTLFVPTFLAMKSQNLFRYTFNVEQWN